MDADRRVQRRRRLPRAVAHRADELADSARGAHRNPAAVASHGIAVRRQTADGDLQTLDRGIDVAPRPARPSLLPHAVPRLERLAELEQRARPREIAEPRKAKL